MKRWIGMSMALCVMAPIFQAAATELTCPQSVAGAINAAKQPETHAFRYVSFFDGDPSEIVNLAPEDGPNPKVLEQRWQFTRTPGRPINMICRYHGTEETVKVEVPSDVKECRLSGLVTEQGEVVGSPMLECN